MELKENEFKDLFEDEADKIKNYVRDVEIDTDIEMLIPDAYVNIVQERLNLYTEIDQIENEDELVKFRDGMKDRFGPLPIQIDELFNGLRLRWIAKRLGFERVILKEGRLSCFFISNPQSAFFESKQFQAILEYISTGGTLVGLSLKQSKTYLIMKKANVKNLKAARVLLQQVEERVAEGLKQAVQSQSL